VPSVPPTAKTRQKYHNEDDKTIEIPLGEAIRGHAVAMMHPLRCTYMTSGASTFGDEAGGSAVRGLPVCCVDDELHEAVSAFIEVDEPLSAQFEADRGFFGSLDSEDAKAVDDGVLPVDC